MGNRRDVDDADKRPTVAICLRCQGNAIRGGPIVPSFEFISAIGECAFGDTWSFCALPPVEFKAWEQP